MYFSIAQLSHACISTSYAALYEWITEANILLPQTYMFDVFHVFSLVCIYDRDICDFIQ